MKTFLKTCLLVALAAGIGLRAGASPFVTQDDKWAELETFHGVMSETFHPAEEGNLKPIRSRAAEMAEKARQWRDSKPPKLYDTPEIKEKVGKLTVESKALAERMAKNPPDEEVKAAITALHDRFHEIIGACREEKKKHQH